VQTILSRDVCEKGQKEISAGWLKCCGK